LNHIQTLVSRGDWCNISKSITANGLEIVELFFVDSHFVVPFSGGILARFFLLSITNLKNF
jgi:hypothetical protein